MSAPRGVAFCQAPCRRFVVFGGRSVASRPALPYRPRSQALQSRWYCTVSVWESRSLPQFFPLTPRRAITRAAGRRFLGLVLCHPPAGATPRRRGGEMITTPNFGCSAFLDVRTEGGGLPNSISAALMDSGSRANSFQKFRNELPQGHRAGTLKKTPAVRDICAESRSSD